VKTVCVHGLEKSPQFNGHQSTATLEGLNVEHDVQVRVMLDPGNILALQKRNFTILFSNPTSAEILADSDKDAVAKYYATRELEHHPSQASYAGQVRIVGFKHQIIVQSSKSVGYALQMTSKPLETKEACELYRRAIKIQQKLGSNDDYCLATLRWNLQTAEKSVAGFDERHRVLSVEVQCLASSRPSRGECLCKYQYVL